MIPASVVTLTIKRILAAVALGLDLGQAEINRFHAGDLQVALHGAFLDGGYVSLASESWILPC